MQSDRDLENKVCIIALFFEFDFDFNQHVKSDVFAFVLGISIDNGSEKNDYNIVDNLTTGDKQAALKTIDSELGELSAKPTTRLAYLINLAKNQKKP